MSAARTVAGDARAMRDQRRAAWLAAVTAWLVVAAFVAGKIARDAILLARFDVTRLPLFVGLASALSLPIVIGAGRLIARLGPSRLMPIAHLASAGLLILEWLALARWPAVAAVATFLHLSALGAVLVSGFWSIVNERFDARAAKRQIGRIGMAATVGGIAGGVIAERTAALLSADKLLVVLAGLHVAAGLALRLLGTGAPRPVEAVPGERPGQALRLIARSSLLRNVAVVVVLGAVAGSLLDFVLKARIASSPDGVLRSLALYYTITNVATAVVQIAFGGPLIARLGVPRSVAALPLAVVAFGGAALAMPTVAMAAIARGAEAVTRNSVYRMAYELLYAPLPEHDKRATKVVLDVGAERIGDVLGAQLVGAIVYVVAAPRVALQLAAIATAAIALAFAARLPRSYRAALEHQLRCRVPSRPAPAPQAWQSLIGPLVVDEPDPRLAHGALHAAPQLADLRSADPARVRRALDEPIGRGLVPQVIALLAWDEVAAAARSALHRVAPRDTDLLVAALLHADTAFAARRRLPGILVAGDPARAMPGLWRALGDRRFEVRYRSGAALAELAAAGHVHDLTPEDVFDAVDREISIDLRLWQSHRLLDGPGDHALQRVLAHRSSTGLAHVFTLLGLVLPAEPLRLALQAIDAGDRALRGTALEYLESVLPDGIRARLWPFLELDQPARPPVFQRAELLAALDRAHPSLRADLPIPQRFSASNEDWTRASRSNGHPTAVEPRST